MAIESVPFITLNRFEEGFAQNFLKKVEGLVHNTQFVGGEELTNLEAALSKRTQAKHVIGCANGTDAIQLALRAVGIDQGDKVLLPDMTFWATFEAVVNVNGKPITVDVNRDTCHWDFETFKEAVDKFSPQAAVLVHLYGWACEDTFKIREYAKEKNVKLVEDGAQCYGTTLNGRSILGSALIATTSFYPAKVLGASGDAGAVFTNDEKLADLVRSLGNHGRSQHYSHSCVGWNSRLGSYEAAYLNLSLEHIDARLDSRRRAVAFYQEALADLPIKVKTSAAGVTENGYCAVAFVSPQTRVDLIEHLKAHKVGFGTIYPGAMSQQEGATKFLEEKIDHGNAHYVSQAVINLPCFSYISSEELDYVAKIVRAFYKSR